MTLECALKKLDVDKNIIQNEGGEDEVLQYLTYAYRGKKKAFLRKIEMKVI